MSSREKILAAIRQNKPESQPLSVQFKFDSNYPNAVDKFCDTLKGIGGEAVIVKNYDDIKNHIQLHFAEMTNIVTPIADLSHIADFSLNITDPHELACVNLAVLAGEFGVAENAAVWLTEKQAVHRVLPFICQHLALVIRKADIIENMHRAYERMMINDTGWGCFIAGPSKTADIEQSLVIGAHGARSLLVYIIDSDATL